MDGIAGNKLKKLVDKGTKILFIGSIFLATVIYFLHLLTHFPFFDETINARYLWLIAQGYHPHVDFFCIYPTLGYFLTLPYFRLFPESSYVLLALRLISAVIIVFIGIIYYCHGKRVSRSWALALLPFLLIITDPSVGVFFSEYSLDHLAALAALWAMAIIMSEPRFGRLVLCSALCAASFFLMPKYHLPLFFGFLGYLWTYYVRAKSPSAVVSGLLTGVISALLAITAIFALNAGSLFANFNAAYLFNFNLSSVMGKRLPHSPLFGPVISHIAFFLRHHLLLTGIYMLGIAGWIRYTAKRWHGRDHHIWGGGGILLGCILSTASTTMYTEQYIAPLLLCLALFVPFAFSEIASIAIKRYVMATLVIVVFGTLVMRLDHVADEFRVTPLSSRGNTAIERKLLGEVLTAPSGLAILNEYDRLLGIIPPKETVVAAWPYHPLFRRDLTFQIYDDLPTLSLGLSKNDPLLKTFSPDTFRTALETTPPGLIVLQGMDEYFPPNWEVVASDFVTRHKDLYVPYNTSFLKAYLRRDMIDGNEKLREKAEP